MKLEKIQLNLKAMQCRDDHYNDNAVGVNCSGLLKFY
jgi:hypothetical protein